MSKEPGWDGGPAFPRQDTERTFGSEGMSLRDWFASTATDKDIDQVPGIGRISRIKARWIYADFMLAERNKQE